MSFHPVPLRHDQEVIFYYCGYLSQSILQACVDAVRLRLEITDEDFKVRRKVLSAFIEMGQNIVHYSADCLTDPGQALDEVRFGSLTVAHVRGGRFTVACTNPVDRSTAQRLKPKVELISRMSLDEIKAAYRATLREPEGEAGSKGASLGLLTLARDATESLTYFFREHPRSPDLQIFDLFVTI